MDLVRTAQRVSGEVYADSPLDVRQLGRRGPMVPILCLGGQNIFSLGTYEQSKAVFMAAIEAGVRYVDTAYSYENSVERIGRILSEEGDNLPELFIATKSAQRIRSQFLLELDEMIEKLGRTPDLVHVHSVTKGEGQVILGKDGPLEAAEEARSEGMCRFVGMTSHDDPCTMLEILRRTDSVDVTMVSINPADLRFTGEYTSYCAQRGIGVVAMKVMGRGQLVRPDGPGVRTAAEAIRFPLSQRGVNAAVVGTSYPEEIGELAVHCENFVPMEPWEQRDLVDGTVPYAQDVWFYRSEIKEWDIVDELRPAPDWYEPYIEG